jgi:peptide chain release factor 1
MGGLRYISANVSGQDVFSFLKFESGVHRVQRVPKTERAGRVHTSTVTVAVLPKLEEIKIELNQNDLKIEPCRSSGPGGQHVNKTMSAIRVTHLPTGIVVNCQEERHQIQNRKKALNILKLKLYTKQYEENLEAYKSSKKTLVGSAARSERIRTYNYLQDRISDHRLDENFHNIEEFLLGGYALDELINSLKYEQIMNSINDLV